MFKANNSYSFGVAISLLLHLGGAALGLFMLERNAAEAARAPQVFSVTLEGGASLGGITQVPDENASAKELEIPPSDAVPDTAEEESASTVKDEKSLEAPSVVEDPQKILEEKKKKEAEEQKKKAELKKLEEKKQKELERKKKAEEAKKLAEEKAKQKKLEAKRKAEEEKKRKLALERKKRREKKARDARLAEISNRLKSNYKGESANAGGQGLGAAKLGGNGMGGGVLASAEKIAYQKALTEHVKRGWRWLPGARKLTAVVVIRLLPSGQIQDIRIQRSSGNSNFDDSITRAVRKADPVPPPPSRLYREFSEVRITFDSHDR